MTWWPGTFFLIQILIFNLKWHKPLNDLCIQLKYFVIQFLNNFNHMSVIAFSYILSLTLAKDEQTCVPSWAAHHSKMSENKVPLKLTHILWSKSNWASYDISVERCGCGARTILGPLIHYVQMNWRYGTHR